MPYVLVRHKIEDYARWKPVFDGDASARQAGGCKGGHLFRNAQDPNELIVLFEWDDMQKLQQFVQSPQLQEKMQQSGVSDRPDVYFLEEVEKLSA